MYIYTHHNGLEVWQNLLSEDEYLFSKGIARNEDEKVTKKTIREQDYLLFVE